MKIVTSLFFEVVPFNINLTESSSVCPKNE